MNHHQYCFTKVVVVLSMMMLALPVGCVPVGPRNGGGIERPDGRHDRPPSGVVEMDQNTDPRFYRSDYRGVIGRLKIAGNKVRLNGRRLDRDSDIESGDHVSTGPASAAIIEFVPFSDSRCGFEIRDLWKGRIYGSTDWCFHMVSMDRGVMETRQGPASYHVDARDAETTVITAIDGETLVWLRSNPEYKVTVPSYHQVSMSHSRISPPQRVSRSDVVSITNWRENFRRYRKRPVTVPDLKDWKLEEVLRTMDSLGLRLDVNPERADRSARVYRQSPRAGAEAEQGSVVTVYVRPDVQKVTVPNLKSKSLADARRMLKQLGLGLRYSPRNASEQYWVVSQEPSSGSKVDRGTEVNLRLQPPLY